MKALDAVRGVVAPAEWERLDQGEDGAAADLARRIARLLEAAGVDDAAAVAVRIVVRAEHDAAEQAAAIDELIRETQEER